MEEDERQSFVEMLDIRPDCFLQNMSSNIKVNSTSSKKIVHDFLAIIDDKMISMTKIKTTNLKNHIKQYSEDEDESETLLHVAVKYSDDSYMISRIVEICPELLTFSRRDSKNYKGQTPLHIAITKSDYDVTERLLSESKYIKTILKTKATGRLFTNTVMLGELPLNVAALTFNENIVDILLEKKAKMRAKNSCGDTVFHSLVKYSAVYPSKSGNVIKMFTYLTEKMKKGRHGRYQSKDTDIFLKDELYMWVLENNDCLTPLQLSAKLGVVEIFQYIINLENVYSFVSTHDGLFDVKLYDITEIDTVANQHVATITNANEGSKNEKVARNIDGVSRKKIQSNTNCNPIKCSQFDYPKTESILEMMFDYDYQNQSAFRIIETIPVKNIILEKWQKLRYFYFIWGFLHLLMTVCMTAELVIRSELYALETASNTTTVDNHIPVSSRTFASIVSWTSFILGGKVYCFIIILLLIAKARRPNALRYIFHNLEYLFFLIVFSVCLFIDFFMTIANEKHDNIALILAVIAGWWFSVFFLRAIQRFSFFTEMIRRVIVGDLFRFAIFISFMFFAFTAGIYAAFVGAMDSEQKTPSYHNAVNEHFSSFGGAMLTMFKLMLGLDDFGVLNEARIPGLAIALYIVFALLTYVLLINSLIAMMSQTCAVVLENRYPQWRLQQLSVVLFLEDLFCLCCIRRIFGSPGTVFFPKKEISYLNQVTKQPKVRYFFKIHSLQTTYASEEDREAMKNVVKEKEPIRMEGSFRAETLSTTEIPQSGTPRPQCINRIHVRDTTSETSVKTPFVASVSGRNGRIKRSHTLVDHKLYVDDKPYDFQKGPPQVDIESNPKFK